MNIESVIQNALQAAFPPASPFLILREAGLVSHLRAALIASAGQPVVRAELRNAGSPPKSFPFTSATRIADAPAVDVLCVQQEIKVTGLAAKQAAANPEDDLYQGVPDDDIAGAKSSTGDKSRTDIVILNQCGPNLPVITCERSGPGDVVASIDWRGIAAAIEVKACPTFDGNQLILLLKDVARLYRFAKSGIQTHMVLADKSSEAVFGSWENPRPKTVIEWAAPAEGQCKPIEELLDSHKGNKPEREFNQLRTLHSLGLHGARPTNSSEPFVTFHVAGVNQALYIYQCRQQQSH